jgi:hypothetical protein
MIIDSPNQSNTPLIFVHIPKTGGMSTLNSLSCFEIIYHKNIKHDIEKIKNKNKNPENYLSFTIIRNPWDRMVSNYFFHKQRTHNDITLHKLLFKPDEKEKLKNWIEKHNDEDEFWKKHEFKDWLKLFGEKESTKSSSIYHDTIKTTYMDLIGVNGKISVDYIINLHNFKKEINLIKTLSGKPFNDPKHVHKNKSDHKDYREYYDSKSIEIVEKLFKKDIEVFNFKFDVKEYAEYENYINHEKVKRFIKASFKLI